MAEEGREKKKLVNGGELHTVASTSSIKSITATTERELLAKLEEQNRLLEADAKSLKSIQESAVSWRGSQGSLQSDSSNTSNLSNLASSSNNGDTPEPMSVQDQWLIWGKIVNEWEEYSKRKAKPLKELVRMGIPTHFRGIVWQLLCDAYNSPLKAKYAEYLKRHSTYERVIRRDINRTYPEHEFFKEKDGPGQETLFNVMKAYSLHDREVGYCQGSAFIVGLLLMQMPEEEAFCVLVKLMQDYKLREIFKPSMAELGLCIFQIECLVQDLLPDLFQHFTTQSLSTSMYASSWFLTLFATSLPLPLACRVMDAFISEGMEIIFRVGLAILQLNYDMLIQLDLEEMLRFLKNEAPKLHAEEPDLLIQTAFQIKINQKKMKKLEKEYFLIKTKENEDQIEMRRLRTENNLLRQKVDILEKENEAIADKLIQGQLCRAQEAEELYSLRKVTEDIKNDNKRLAEENEGAKVVITELRDKARSGSNSTVLDKEAEAIIVALQEELIAVRLREAETTESLKELTEKIQKLEETSRRARDDPNHSVAAMQDELIAVKLREAEANMSLKELKMKVSELEAQWQKQLQKASSNRKQGAVKPTIQTLTEELMSSRLREAEAVADLKEVKQRVMELQTQNQMTGNQMRRIEEERLQLSKEVVMSGKQKEVLQNRLYEAQKELCKLEARSQEEQINLRLRETETKATVLELKQRIAGLEIKNQELLTMTTLSDSEASQNVQEMQNKIHELNREVSHLRGVSTGTNDGEPSILPQDDDETQEVPPGIDLSVLDSDDDLDKS